jgi:serine/arginine repetitive matrix protein 1
MKFPKELDAKVDVRALRAKTAAWAVIKEWIARRITQLLGGLEEEVLISFVFNQLEVDQVCALATRQQSNAMAAI